MILINISNLTAAQSRTLYCFPWRLVIKKRNNYEPFA